METKVFVGIILALIILGIILIILGYSTNIVDNIFKFLSGGLK
ncbi:MAG: hypothetical protein N3D75_03080 [Candidatus Aenigmarchaeota archaeon]|nr:hypothetical protein [Candidatus Aenigmarchaeota archaeon]